MGVFEEISFEWMPKSSGDVLVAVKKYYLTATRTSPLLLNDICEKILNRLLGLDGTANPTTATKTSPPPSSPCTKCEEKDTIITRLSSTVENQSSTLNGLVKKLASAPISGIARSQKTG